MNIRRIGVILILIGLLAGIGITMVMFLSDHDLCLTNSDPLTLFSHVLLGFLVSILSLGCYILYLGKGEDDFLTSVRQDHDLRQEDYLWSILLQGLSVEEQKVLSAVKIQDGISQHTLSLRTDMHKSKLSITLSALEKKNLISRTKHGKVNYIHLKVHFPGLHDLLEQR